MNNQERTAQIQEHLQQRDKIIENHEKDNYRKYHALSYIQHAVHEKEKRPGFFHFLNQLRLST